MTSAPLPYTEVNDHLALTLCFGMHERGPLATEGLNTSSVSAVLLDKQMGFLFSNNDGCRTPQHLYGEHQARNSPRPSHLHFFGWETYIQPTLCRWERFDDAFQQIYQQTNGLNAYGMRTCTDKSKVICNGNGNSKAEIWRHHLTHAQWSPCTRLNYSGDERHLAAAAEWLSTHNLHCCLFLEHSEHHSARIAFVSYFSLHDHHRQKRGQALFLCLGKEGSDVHGN